MQQNGVASDLAEGGATNSNTANITINNDNNIPDMATASSVVTPQVQQNAAIPQQQQQHQQHHHQQHQPQHPSPHQVLHSGVPNNHHHPGFTGSTEHHHHHHQSQQQQQQQGGYYQRLAQPQYHNQQQHQHHHQQPMQHYHHNKYNNNNTRSGAGLGGAGQDSHGRAGGGGGADNESNVNHVLLITVINPHYPITCDLIHQICSTYGKVNRIVIFKKNGVQAMVEFDNVDSAKRAKTALYGCDIYSGCCTLRIEYAKPTRLNIHKNDNDSFDYTTSNPGANVPQNNDTSAAPINNNVGGDEQQSSGPTNHNSRASMRSGNGASGGGMQHFHPPHLANTQGIQPTNPGQHGNSTYGNPSDQESNTFQTEDNFNIPRGAGTAAAGYQGNEPYLQAHVHHAGHHQHGNMYSRHEGHHIGHRMNLLNNSNIAGHNQSNSFSSVSTSGTLMLNSNNLSMQPQGTVMMVYGLQSEKVNCDRLFNLFCLYGNVVRVKFLRTKEGCAMVQMGDVLAVDRCVSSLNKISLFNSELQISYSKQAFLHDVIQPFILPDGSLSFKDFMGNKNNRFKNPEVASKNRILPPSQVLHFFNAPFGISEDELVHLFKSTSGHEPVSVKIFTPKTDNTKSYTGLVTFKDAADATEALVVCNHLSMPKPGAPHPYILRLCFSPPAYTKPAAGDPSSHR